MEAQKQNLMKTNKKSTVVNLNRPNIGGSSKRQPAQGKNYTLVIPILTGLIREEFAYGNCRWSR